MAYQIKHQSFWTSCTESKPILIIGVTVQFQTLVIILYFSKETEQLNIQAGDNEIHSPAFSKNTQIWGKCKTHTLIQNSIKESKKIANFMLNKYHLLNDAMNWY